MAEAAIKIVKSLSRTTVLDWPTARRFINGFNPYLVPWVVQSINYSLRRGTLYASPNLRFTGKPVIVNVNVHLRFAFIDIFAVHKTESDSIHNLESKCKIGLVVARNGEASAVIVLDLESMKECKRQHANLMDGSDVKL
jgi:hypothetical protein